MQAPWAVPWGAYEVEADPLSALFLAVIGTVCPLAALYGVGYLRGRERAGGTWFFFNLLVASMVLVVVARNAVLFLVAWEGMSLSAFALILLDDQDESVARAAWSFLVAAHIGVAFLLFFFLLASRHAPGLSFSDLARLDLASPQAVNVLLLLALIGFGTKAGVFPLHGWLPEAHPAAPSHVSAVLSGVMLKLGLYGWFRVVSWWGAPASWWPWLLIAAGLVSSVLGVLFSLAQHDLKRALAYSSIENIGLILLAAGVGMLGMNGDAPLITVMGFGAALLHVLNHSLMKPLLFLAAGAVAHGTGTRDVNLLGGLLKRMPLTGACFLVGSAAIAGLPPLNGFGSEFALFIAALKAAIGLPPAMALAAAAVLAGLAFVGGLAVASFARLMGGVFLGEPRSDAAVHAHEAGVLMRAPVLILAAFCVLAAAALPRLAALCLEIARAHFAPSHGIDVAAAVFPLSSAVWIFALLLVAAGVALTARLLLLRRRTVRRTVTWDCGYAAPSARMQYTPSSFAQPLTAFFGDLLRPRRRLRFPDGFFPTFASFRSSTPDLLQREVVLALIHRVEDYLARVRWLQHGRLHGYVLYIAVVVLILVIWTLGRWS